MKMIKVVVLICLFVGITTGSCPCKSESLCRPINKKFKNIVYFYVSQANIKYYKYFDWSRISTISVGTVDKNLMPLVCYAHSKNVKVNIYFGFSKKILQSETLIGQLVGNITNVVKRYYLDGINIDFEGILHKGDPAIMALTKFVSKMNSSIKHFNSKLEVSFAHNYLAEGSVFSYDSKGIDKAIDYFVIMDYDFSRRTRGLCTGGDNAGLPRIKEGVQSFKKLGISPNRLILALPWFGLQLQCQNVNKKTGFCSGDCKFQREICYSSIVQKLYSNSTDGRRYNKTTSSPYMIYEAGQTYRIDYDDHLSLKLKNEFAKQVGAKGVGVFQGNCMPVGNSKVEIRERKLLWSTLPLTSEEYPQNDSVL